MTAKHLPIATAFCAVELPLFDGLSFFLDGNSKITRENGTYLDPKPNAFSLPAASVDASTGACPGSTTVCRESCYVRGLAVHASDVYARYVANAKALAVVLTLGNDRAFFHSALKLAQWIEENAAAGFRWHVSGDVLHAHHALWITEVCNLAPDVPFWIYTRTFDAVPTLCTARNLAVNVSADVENYAKAREVAAANGARLCYMATPGAREPLAHRWTEFHENAPPVCSVCGAYAEANDYLWIGTCTRVPADLPPGSVIFPDYALRTRKPGDDATWWQSLSHEQRVMICPADQFSQSESHRCGPCKKCL